MGTYRKMKTYKKKRSGFTIIELMIVIVIVAILVSLAYPSYVQYVRKAKRGEAQQLLLNWAINQEIWRSNNTLYNGVTDTNSPDYIIPGHDDYDFDAPAFDTASYTLRAVAKTGNDQLKDKARNGDFCSTLNLNSAGRKYSEDNIAKLACWD